MELAGCSRGEDGGGARVVGMVRRVLPRVARAGIRFRIMLCRLEIECVDCSEFSRAFSHTSQRFTKNQILNISDFRPTLLDQLAEYHSYDPEGWSSNRTGGGKCSTELQVLPST